MKTEEFFKSEPTHKFVYGQSIKNVSKRGITKAKSVLLQMISDQLIQQVEVGIIDSVKFNYDEEEGTLSVKYH